MPLKKTLEQLSRGQRSMLGAVLALASRAELTLLDEVYLGMDAVVLDRGRAVVAGEADTVRQQHSTGDSLASLTDVLTRLSTEGTAS